MITKEREYDDKEITIRESEIVKLSELTKEERDLYFAGVSDGETDTITTITIFFGIIILGILIAFGVAEILG